MSKVLCTNCNKVFDSPSETSEVITCPKCGVRISLTQAKENANKEYKKIMDAAYKYTYQMTNYNDGYLLYKKALIFREDDLSALVGMSLCLIFNQAFDDLKFKDVITLFDEHNIYLDKENTFIFLMFVKDVLRQVKYLFDQIEKRLKENDVFLNETYFEYFKNAVNDSLTLFNYFNDSFLLMDQEEFEEFKTSENDFIDNFNTYFDKLNNYKNESFNVNNVGLIKFDNTLIEEKKYGVFEKNIEDLHVILINKNFKKNATLLLILMVSLIVISLILLIVGLSVSISAISYCSLIPLGIFAIISFIFYKKNKNK